MDSAIDFFSQFGVQHATSAGPISMDAGNPLIEAILVTGMVLALYAGVRFINSKFERKK